MDIFPDGCKMTFIFCGSRAGRRTCLRFELASQLYGTELADHDIIQVTAATGSATRGHFNISMRATRLSLALQLYSIVPRPFFRLKDNVL